MVTAQTITISVMPSVLTVDLTNSETKSVDFKFWNDGGDSDAIYVVEPEPCLKSILVSYEKEFLVPKGTSMDSPVVKTFVFKRDGTGGKECRIIFYGYPKGYETEGVKVRYAVASRVKILQPKLESSREPEVKGGGNGIPSGFAPLPKPSENPSPSVVSYPKDEEKRIGEAPEAPGSDSVIEVREEGKVEEREEPKGFSFLPFLAVPAILALGFIGFRYLKNYLGIAVILFLLLPMQASATEVSIKATATIVPKVVRIALAGIWSFTILTGGISLYLQFLKRELTFGTKVDLNFVMETVGKLLIILIVTILFFEAVITASSGILGG